MTNETPHSDQHWSKIAERGTILGMQFLVWVDRFIGRWLFSILLFPVIYFYYLVRSDARSAAKIFCDRVRHIQPESHISKLAPFWMFYNFAHIILDKFKAWQGLITHEDVFIEDIALFNEVNARSVGGIIIISHLGNSDVSSALAQQLPNLKLTILVHTLHAQKFNKMLNRHKKHSQNYQNIEFLQVSTISPETAIALAQRVKAGEHIVIAGDRTPIGSTGRTCEVRFLGQTALFPQGPYILASILKCPVTYLYCIKTQILKKGQYTISMEQGHQIQGARKDRDHAINAGVAHYAASLEKRCLATPLQWFNFYNFWSHKL